MVSFSSRISPRASTVIFWLRSPLATAVVTSAMERTWSVRLAAITLTDSVRSFQVPDTPLTSAWPPSSPSVPTSRATRVTSSAKEDSWSTIVFRVDFSSRISPRASTSIFWLRSPLATAVATWAMLRTWPVRLPAIAFTESVRSFQVPDTPGTSAWPPSLPSVPTSRATRVTSEVNRSSWSAIPLNTVAISSMSGSPVWARRVLKSPPRTAVRPASSCSSPDSSSRGPDWTVSVTKRSHQLRRRAATRVRHRRAISTDGRPEVTIMGRADFFAAPGLGKAPPTSRGKWVTLQGPRGQGGG